jgi:glutamyl-Q tRNA(Asp) synthetase
MNSIDLSPLARGDRPILTRFAPSPTGYLHLGHVVNAIYVWGVAGAAGGEVLLRIEDHDRIRCRAAYEEALLEDLDWLGFVPGRGRHPLHRQSDMPHRYAEALTALRRRHQVYACDCSRREIRLRQDEGEATERYSGRCRDRDVADAGGVGLRVVIGPGVEEWRDLRLGHTSQAPASQCGDLLVRDRDGHWTYQFAVTVDDWRDDVTLVVRGEDLLSSTGRQLRLAKMLGRQRMPLFLHHPLIMQSSGEKLSKATGASGVRELRARGVSAAEVIGRAATAVGLNPGCAPIEAANVRSLFSPAQ